MKPVASQEFIDCIILQVNCSHNFTTNVELDLQQENVFYERNVVVYVNMLQSLRYRTSLHRVCGDPRFDNYLMSNYSTLQRGEVPLSCKESAVGSFYSMSSGGMSMNKSFNQCVNQDSYNGFIL